MAKTAERQTLEGEFVTYTMNHAIEGDMLRLSFSGTFDHSQLQDTIEQVWTWVQTAGAQYVLVDIRGLIGRASLSQTFFNIRSYPTDAARIRTAIVELPQHMENAEFHDTAAGNLGFSIKHFVTEEEALAWLRAPTAALP